jgi:hypothetical protein
VELDKPAPGVEWESHDGTIEGVVLALLQHLDNEQDQVARVIGQAGLQEIAEYEALAAPDRFEEVVADTRLHLEMFCRCAPARRMPDSDELSFIADLAQQRAAAAFPLEAMLNAYRVGHRVLWDWLISQVADPHKGEIALALTPFMHDYLGTVTRKLTSSYSDATPGPSADESDRQLLHMLATNDDLPRALAMAEARGIAASGQYIASIAGIDRSADGSRPDLLGRGANVIRRNAIHSGMNVLVTATDNEIMVLVVSPGDARGFAAGVLEPAGAALDQMYGAGLVAGCSLTYGDLAESPLAFGEAHQAVARASQAECAGGVVWASFFDSLLAASSSAVSKRVPPWIPALTGEPGSDTSDLLRTLHAYLNANLSIERTARACFVHPNTVRYRLRRISKLTGLDLNRFYDLVELLAALRVASDNAAAPAQRSAAASSVPEQAA